MRQLFDNQVILITGGTGSFGQKYAEKLLTKYNPRKVIIFSRDELKQHDMKSNFSGVTKGRLLFFLGDVRDLPRLQRAFDGVDIVVHAAALKQVPAAEYNPMEAIKTNILGASNVIEAAIDRNVRKVIALSTDKAASPVNLYGATKLCSEKLFVAGNHYSGKHDTRFSVVRYGNVLGSRGSVLPFFLSMKASGSLPITDTRMTRFCLTLEQGVEFVEKCTAEMIGGETFVPKIPSMKVTDLATAVAPECKQEVVGIRPGEKLHEALVTSDESRSAVELKDKYVIMPTLDYWDAGKYISERGGVPVSDGFSYSSDNNSDWLSVEQIKQLCQEHGS